jgi:hypothetical protein
MVAPLQSDAFGIEFRAAWRHRQFDADFRISPLTLVPESGFILPR